MSLTDWGFELDGFPFGCGTTIEVTGWEPGSGDTRDQDTLSGFRDARVFGRDRVTPPVWPFTLSIKETDEAAALEVLEPLAAAWDATELRETPQATSTLRYRIGGRSRVVFGRPRRFTPVVSNLIFGRVPVAADFALAHLGSFDDELLSSPPLKLGASELGGSGITFPITFPVLWGGVVASPRHTTIDVGGRRATPLQVAITGGMELTHDPYVIVTPLRIDGTASGPGRLVQFVGTVAPGETVTAYAQPWDARLSRADGSAAALTLAPGSSLSDLIVPPGRYQVSFGGVDGSGTASCVFAWRGAHQSI